jgi:hypothetical protein
MRYARSGLVAVALALLAPAGCGPAKLNEERTYTMDATEVQTLDLPAIAQPQTVTVEFSSSASPASVYLLQNFKADDAQMIPTKDQILATKQGKEGTFSADVPAKTATRVLIRGLSAKTEVKLKVTNKK